jgi:hypothetical protein
VDPVAFTTELKEDIDGGPLEVRCHWVRQHSQLRLKKTSMAGPLGALPVGPTTFIIKVEEDVNGGPLGGAADGSGSIHHRC